LTLKDTPVRNKDNQFLTDLFQNESFDMSHRPDFEPSSLFLILKISYLSRSNLDCNLQHDSSPNPRPPKVTWVTRGHARSIQD